MLCVTQVKGCTGARSDSVYDWIIKKHIPVSILIKLFVMTRKNNGIIWLYCSTARQLIVTGTTLTESQ
jgi:hypothetical protein